MNKELSIMHENSMEGSEEALAKTRLTQSVIQLAQSIYEAEQDPGMIAGQMHAAVTIVNNVPMIDQILDGKLMPSPDSRSGEEKRNYKDKEVLLSDRRNRIPAGTQEGARKNVDALPVEVVLDTQNKLDGFLAMIRAVATFPAARRLQAYLPIAIPETRAGFMTLTHIASKYSEAVVLDADKGVYTEELRRVLAQLDRKVSEAAQADQNVLQTLNLQARKQAGKKLIKLQTESSLELAEIRSVVAERKLSDLRREAVDTGGGRVHSSYEILANEIIDADNLDQQLEELSEKQRALLSKARDTVLNTLTRKRSIRRVVSMIEQDPLVCEAVARRFRMNGNELREADERKKTLVADNLLNSRPFIVSIEERRSFNGGELLSRERRRLEEFLDDPLTFIAGLSDEEVMVIKQGIPKISEAKSVFSLAKERLKRRIEETVTDNELLDILTQQTVKELFPERSAMAVDSAIRDLGINSASLLRNPAILLDQADSIVTDALKYIVLKSSPLRLPNVQVMGADPTESSQILQIDRQTHLTEKNVIDLLDKLAESQQLYGVKIENREGVKTYMVDQKARETLIKVSKFLADLSEISDTVILPETEDEMSCLLAMAVNAIVSGKPLTLVTPTCPDWSRDSEGRYDFKSLGGGESYIAAKFFANAPEILSVFNENVIPYKGVLLFADWGLETEIEAKGTYGQKLSPEDVQMCFASTVASTDQTLKALQESSRFGRLFANYEIISMREFIARNIDEEKVGAQMRSFFTSDMSGKRLLQVLAQQSLPINRSRLGLSEEENREFALRNLVEYSTVGQAVGEHSILMVCESRTTSRCYNMPRDKDKNVPVFYVKGKGSLEGGVNIL